MSLTGRDAEQEGHGGKGGGEAQAAAGENEGGTANAKHDASVTGKSGSGKSRRKVGQEQGNRDTTRGRRGDGAGGTHHGTSTFGLSCRQCLLQMWANVNVQDPAMRVPQGRSCLRDMLVFGAVCQPRAPDSSGRDAEQGGHRGNGGRETQASSRKSEGGTANASNATSATGESGEGDWRRQGGREQGNSDWRVGRRFVRKLGEDLKGVQDRR